MDDLFQNDTGPHISLGKPSFLFKPLILKHTLNAKNKFVHVYKFSEPQLLIPLDNPDVGTIDFHVIQTSQLSVGSSIISVILSIQLGFGWSTGASYQESEQQDS